MSSEFNSAAFSHGGETCEATWSPLLGETFVSVHMQSTRTLVLRVIEIVPCYPLENNANCAAGSGNH